jgi:plastocyanin
MTGGVHRALTLVGTVTLTLAGTTLAGCSSDQDPFPITVQNVAFSPKEITVSAGTEVGWYYEDGGTFHDILIEELNVDAGFRQEGEWEYTFETPGTYRVTCSIHPSMIGTIVVT